MHLTVCPDCDRIAKTLGQTVELLHTVSPALPSQGFDASLAQRLAAARAQRDHAVRRSWFSRMAFDLRARLSVDAPAIRAGVRISAPLVVAASVLAFMVAFNPAGPASHTAPPAAGDVSQGFAPACQHEQESYISSQPFADPSAQALMQRQTDDSLAKEGAVLLGSGNI